MLRALSEPSHGTIGGAYIRDVVFSANDGLITTFAVVAGVAGASLSYRIVVIMGLANLLADGISMALGNYLGIKSRIDFERTSRRTEENEVKNMPGKEREEMEDIARLRNIPAPRVAEWISTMTSDKRLWIDEMLVWELGILPEEGHPVRTGIATFIAFAVAGFFPLIPYVFNTAGNKFTTSIVITALVLFGVGSLRSLVTKRNWVRSGIEMLLVGGTAAVAAYIVGAWLAAA